MQHEIKSVLLIAKLYFKFRLSRGVSESTPFLAIANFLVEARCSLHLLVSKGKGIKDMEKKKVLSGVPIGVPNLGKKKATLI